MKGQLLEAINEYQAVLRLQPDWVEAHLHMGHTYRELGQILEAREAFEQVLQIKPDLREAHQALESLPK